MKLNKTIAIAAAMATALAVNAQGETRTAYFLDGYSFRHELNPAFGNDHTYVSVPVLGDLSVGIHSNVGVDNFLYRTTGGQYKLTTFMSPYVDADEFLKRMPGMSRINGGLDMTLLSAGFRAFGGFNTVSIGVSAGVSAKIPKSFFEFAKVGQEGNATEYDIDGMKLRGNAIADISLGHSRKITDKIRVGAKFKFLIGAGDVRADIDNLHVRLADDKWMLRANGSMKAAAGSGLVMPTYAESGKEYSSPGMADRIDWDGIEYNNFSLSGYGAAIDLGATWEVMPGLEVSAALNDLGFISWKDVITASMPGIEWSFDGFHNVAFKSSQDDYENKRLKDQWDTLSDDFKDAMNFHRTGVNEKSTEFLAATLHLGAEYKMPFYDKLSAAFLYTGHYGDCDLWNEGRIYAIVKPVRWFNATVNYAYSTFGNSFGWMLNFHPRGFNFFVGSDHMIFKITPQGIPVGRATANVNLGFNVSF